MLVQQLYAVWLLSTLVDSSRMSVDSWIAQVLYINLQQWVIAISIPPETLCKSASIHSENIDPKCSCSMSLYLCYLKKGDNLRIIGKQRAQPSCPLGILIWVRHCYMIIFYYRYQLSITYCAVLRIIGKPRGMWWSDTLDEGYIHTGNAMGKKLGRGWEWRGRAVGENTLLFWWVPLVFSS